MRGLKDFLSSKGRKCRSPLWLPVSGVEVLRTFVKVCPLHRESSLKTLLRPTRRTLEQIAPRKQSLDLEGEWKWRIFSPSHSRISTSRRLVPL